LAFSIILPVYTGDIGERIPVCLRSYERAFVEDHHKSLISSEVDIAVTGKVAKDMITNRGRKPS